MRLPMLILHITAGTLGMLSGFAAIFFGKGSRRHRVAGNVFVVSMLIMSAMGACLAAMKFQPGNILGGTLTFYLVATAWLIARRGEVRPGMIEWGALVVVATVAALNVTFGLEAALSPSGLKYEYPAGPYFFLGSVAVLATVGDVRMLVGNGISATQRIARHLWRMSFALFIAASSIFLARQHLFPNVLRKTGILVLLSVLPLILMIYWLIRVRFANARKRMGLVATASSPSFATR